MQDVCKKSNNILSNKLNRVQLILMYSHLES